MAGAVHASRTAAFPYRYRRRFPGELFDARFPWGASFFIDRRNFMEKWLSVADAAKYMALSKRTLYRLMESGAVPYYSPVKGKRVLQASELDVYMSGTREMSNEELLRLSEQKLLELELKRRRRS